MTDDATAFTVVAGQHTRCSRDWYWDHPGNRPGWYNLWLTETGSGELHIDGRPHAIVGGDCLVIPLAVPVRARQDRRRPLTVTWLFTRLPGPPPPLRRHLADQRFLRELLGRAIRARLDAPDDPAATADWVRAAVRAIAEYDRAAPDNRIAATVKTYAADIRADPNAPLALAARADAAGYSADHFSRAFRRHLGTTPRAFRIRARIERAQDLLRMTSEPITAIADQLGFSDAFHFSKQFSRHSGCSPSAWRHRD